MQELSKVLQSAIKLEEQRLRDRYGPLHVPTTLLDGSLHVRYFAKEGDANRQRRWLAENNVIENLGRAGSRARMVS